MKIIPYISTFLVLANTLSAASYSSPPTREHVSEPSPTTREHVSESTTIKVSKDSKLGEILTDSKGMTLYMFTPDKNSTSTCYDHCAVTWPPLLISSGNPALTSGVAGSLSTTKRRDNSTQVTYNGMPLYYYVKDKKPGDVYGQNVEGKWFVIHPKQ